MAEKPTLHEEMLERVVAYYDGDLAPAEKAAFEAHLATCKDCQYALHLARTALPVAEDMLGFKPKRTIDEQVARFEAKWAEKARAEAAARRPRSTTWLPFGLALGAAAAVAALLLLSRGQNLHPEREAFAPQRTLDGGDAGPR